MLKKEKGITLITLIIYVAAMTLLVAVIANISKSFYKNMSQFSDTNSVEFKVEKFNTFFLKQINTSGVSVTSCTDKNILFSDGTQYEYMDEAIYYKTSDKNLKLCDEVKNLKFEYNNTQKLINVYMSDGANEKTIQYKKK